MNWSYDSALRQNVATAKNGANTLQAADYTWDGENRLVEMKRDTDTPAGARQKLVFEYDHQGRRIRKQFFTYSGGWVEQRDAICLYDAWSVVAELDANASNAKLRTYVWGTDLSGSAQGAGGVGGLLWVNNYQTTFDGQTLPTGIHFVAYDGNGNVSALVKASDGSVSARYEYGPFAEPVRITGALADAQPIRFSTKWTDLESGFLYYGYRYYNPSLGRWVSRNPIEERGGRNLYGFVENAPLKHIDTDGRFRGSKCESCEGWYQGQCNCAGYNDPCAESERRGMSEGHNGWLVCNAGRMIACASSTYRFRSARATDILTRCLLIHEDTHRPDSYCKGKCLHRAILRDDVGGSASKCAAYLEQLRCLLAALHNGECMGEQLCELQVQNEVDGTRVNLRAHCQRGAEW